jgi:hypothetical protein
MKNGSPKLSMPSGSRSRGSTAITSSSVSVTSRSPDATATGAACAGDLRPNHSPSFQAFITATSARPIEQDECQLRACRFPADFRGACVRHMATVTPPRYASALRM